MDFQTFHKNIRDVDSEAEARRQGEELLRQAREAIEGEVAGVVFRPDQRRAAVNIHVTRIVSAAKLVKLMGDLGGDVELGKAA